MINVFIVYGEVGSGKSTLLNFIASNFVDFQLLRNDLELSQHLRNLEQHGYGIEVLDHNHAEKLFEAVKFLYPEARVHIIKSVQTTFKGNPSY